MIGYIDIISAVLPVFLIVIIGWVSRRADILSSESGHSLFKITIRIFFPCFILKYTVGNPAINDASNLLQASLFGFFSVVVMGLSKT